MGPAGGGRGALQRRRRLLCLVVLVTFCVGAVAVGVAVLLGFSDLFEYVLAQQMLLVNGTAAFSEWSAPSSPVVSKFYLFSVANPEDVLETRGAIKPKLLEMGPYTFGEVERKEVVAWHDSNSTVSYRVRKTWHFRPDESGGTLDDVVTTVNFPMIASAYSARGYYWTQFLLSSTFSAIGSRVFIRRTVRQMLFEGYEDELGSIAEMFGQGPAGGGVPMDRFGWFYKRNGTTWADGLYNMHTGEGDASLLGSIASWNHRTNTNYEGHCGEVSGSAGGFYPPGAAAAGHDRLLFFSHEACRALGFNFKRNSTYLGVPVRVFELDETTFANASRFADNACFENNLPTGVQNSTQCKVPSPAFLSFPHFHLADPFFAAQFQSGSIRDSDADRHGSRMAIEPTTSIPLEFVIRIQLNVRLDPAEHIPELDGVPAGLYLPAFWFEATAAASPDAASMVASILDLPRKARAAGLAALCLGALGAAVGIAAGLATWDSRKGRRRGSEDDATSPADKSSSSKLVTSL